MSNNISDNDDLSEILNQMDEMNAAELIEFEKKLKEIYKDDYDSIYDADTDDGDSSFSNLALDFHRRPLETRNKEEPFRIDSPIRSRRKHRNPSRTADYHITAFALDKKEEKLRAYDPEGHDLMNEATRKLCDLYKTLDAFDDIERQFFPKSRSTFAVEDELYPEEQENVPKNDEGNLSEKEEATEKDRRKDVALDKRLRQVYAPEIGRAPYRHDPVNTYHMYKEEWKRRPTPEEQKRLSLRWKVRDLMMSRKFVPKQQPTGEPVQHDKDWSPRPYLD